MHARDCIWLWDIGKKKKRVRLDGTRTVLLEAEKGSCAHRVAVHVVQQEELEREAKRNVQVITNYTSKDESVLRVCAVTPSLGLYMARAFRVRASR